MTRTRRDPHGPVADRVALLLDARDYEETGALWRSFFEDARSPNASIRARH